MEIREATDADCPGIWRFLRPIVDAGETYCYAPDLAEPDARVRWIMASPGTTVVAVEGGPVPGSATACPNQGGGGTHVAGASFMVDPDASGRAVGRALGLHILEWARSAGLRSMQFNAVVETNTSAVALWRSLGFEVLATVPEAFANPRAGLAGLSVMHRRL